ncbi:MAG: CvpA family protein [Verrucomicrobia bacterium]|nr:CvpA family protein [Verrucomicrobiota bacterium]MBI3868106.1 CvpA family protein [Verrucomicrobiota bacterium]
MKYLTDLSISWVDLTMLGALGFGVFQGRKRGISGELLDVIRWIATILIAAFVYQPLSRYFCWVIPGLNPLTASLSVYVGTILTLALVFGALKRSYGEKLLSSDTFGAAEYYLGMIAGVIRMSCVLIAAMALLNAPEYTRMEVQAREKAQEDNFGSIRFFRLYSLQADVFQGSFIGRATHESLGVLLISPNSDKDAGSSRRSSSKTKGKRRNEILDP